MWKYKGCASMCYRCSQWSTVQASSLVAVQRTSRTWATACTPSSKPPSRAADGTACWTQARVQSPSPQRMPLWEEIGLLWRAFPLFWRVIHLFWGAFPLLGRAFPLPAGRSCRLQWHARRQDLREAECPQRGELTLRQFHQSPLLHACRCPRLSLAWDVSIHVSFAS